MSTTTVVKKQPDLKKKVDKIERFLKLVCAQEWNKFVKMESYTKIIRVSKKAIDGKDIKEDEKSKNATKEMETYVNETFEELADSYQRMDEIIPNVKEGLKQMLIECYTAQIDPQEYFMKIFEEINKDVMEELGKQVQNEVKEVLIQKPVGTNDQKEIDAIKARYAEHKKVSDAIEKIQSKEKKPNPKDKDITNTVKKKDSDDDHDVVGMVPKYKKKDKDKPDTGSLGLPKEKKKK